MLGPICKLHLQIDFAGKVKASESYWTLGRMASQFAVCLHGRLHSTTCWLANAEDGSANLQLSKAEKVRNLSKLQSALTSTG